MDSNAQKIAVDEFETDSNFPGVSNLTKDKDGNITNGYGGRILLYDFDDYFNDNDEFVLSKSEYSKNSDGSITLKAGKRLKFYDISYNGITDVSLTFNPMYLMEGGKFYSIEDGALSVPEGYKTKDADGNCIISAQFFTDYPEFFKKGENGSLIVEDKNYTLKQKVSQPQAAIVIMDYKTGGLKAMDSGRSSQVEMIMPPYFSVARRVYAPPSSPFSLTLKVGRSEWLALIMKPLGVPWGTRNARTALPPRVR